MRFTQSLFCASAVLALLASSVSADLGAIQRREDKSSSSTTSLVSSSVASSIQSSSQTDKPSPTTTSAPSDKDAKSSSTSESRISSSGDATPTSLSTAINGALPTTSSPARGNDTITPDPNALPFQPQVTPALAVAGVILLISGLVYTLIGIKNKWLHIFLSTAYLTSLSVTVLVVYVMNPPISKAIQGAYLVAAVITGLVFGALSIVFTEVTEGLGCLLGGFCLGMWFLILKPGGLVTSTVGRVILIACFCAVFFSLSFSHYTRSYGLIAGISFGGATVTVLGIDCFSRAGLKEFWLYIWNLNSNIFPLNTDTFPHTRGIRVEIAAIIIIFLMGITSQMKLWKVVKERREKRAALRLEDERNLEQEEEDVGRRVETEANRDRAEWEAVYGDKDRANRNPTDSGLGDEIESLKKEGESVVATKEVPVGPDGSIELKEIPTQPDMQIQWPLAKADHGDGSSVVVRVARDDDMPPKFREDSVPPLHSERPSTRSSFRNSMQYEAAKMATVHEQESSDAKPSRRNSGVSTMTPAPVAVPLPFTVPSTPEPHLPDEDGSSIATFADSIKEEAPRANHRNSKRESHGSTFKRLSGRSSRRISASTEALVIPHDDDQASSLAATIDGHTDDLDSDSRSHRASHTRLPSLKMDKDALHPDGLHRSSSNSSLDRPTTHESTRPTSMIVPDDKDHHDESKEEKGSNVVPQLSSETVEHDNGGSKAKKSRRKSKNLQKSAPQSPNESEDGEQRDGLRSRSRSLKSVARSEASGRQSFQESLNAQFPARLSKVVMTYRTNEWAKHLSSAEKPEADEIQVSQNFAPEDGSPVESAAPVMVEELQKTPANAVPPPAPRSVSQMSLNSNAMAHPYIDQQAPSRTMSLQSMPRSSVMGRSLSQSSFANYSNPNLLSQPSPAALAPPAGRGFRSPSTPLLNQTLVESPIEEAVEPPQFPPPRQTHSPRPSTTLMGRRDTLLRNKYSISSTALAPTPESAASSVIAPNDSASLVSYRLGMLDTEDLPLSQRKELIRASSQNFHQLQQQYAFPSPQQPQPLINAATTAGPVTMSAADMSFNSHQPKRDSSGAGAPSAERRQSLLASWRESVRADLAGQVQPVVAVDSRREEMLMQRQASIMAAKAREQERGLRDQAFEQRMKQADIMELHREQIRKMQAEAKAS